MENKFKSSFFKRIESDIDNYLTGSIEISEGVKFSQNKTIQRIMRFKNRNLSGSKIRDDLSYDYYFDIISPRADSEIKNLRFDTKHILVFSRSPQKDFPAVFISNAMLKSWMADNGEDEKLKAAVEEFTDNGNIGFKKVVGGYETVDALNTYITNQKAKTIDDTDVIERHELTASQIISMKTWDQEVAKKVIKDLGNKSFTATAQTTPIASTNKRYEIYEFTGEMSEAEYNAIKGIEEEGDENKYFLAKVITAGLKKSGDGEKYVLFADKLTGKISDHYIYAHRGKYNGRFWRVGMYELLFDHQIRANEIGNQLATGLEWASRVIFRSKDSKVLQNIRADLDNGDVIITDDLQQVDVRMHGLDQLIADWNRLMADADRLANSHEIVTGEAMPSGTPFRMGILLDQNSGKLFTLLRQKITLPYKRVFREWVLPEMVKDLKGEDVFTFVGDIDILEQLREIQVNNWYIKNLVKIGPHTREIAEAIKQEKLEEMKKIDPIINNTREIWEGVFKRLFVTITGENSDAADNVQDMVSLMNLETDPVRLAFLLDTIYKIRGIPVPPKQPTVQGGSMPAQAGQEAALPAPQTPGQQETAASIEA
jgi:hypothetical protein